MNEQTKEKKPEIADPPFTAQQIRGATQNGRTYKYKMEADGKPTVKRTIEFFDVTDEATQIRAAVEGAAPQVARATWTDLVGHAAYPKAQTVVTDTSIEVPAGKFDCMLYTVTDGAVITRAYFAKSLPGAPVKHVVEKDGKLVSAMTLLEHPAGRFLVLRTSDVRWRTLLGWHAACSSHGHV